MGCPTAAQTGRLFYEVEVLALPTEHDVTTQFGWAAGGFAVDTAAASNDGVGDDAVSWGLDGVRLKAWHKGNKDYGRRWKAGDILGLAVDTGSGAVLFGLNGSWQAPMGLAYTGQAFPAAGLYPALSALSSTTELTVRVNLGYWPWRYGPPDASFRAVAEGA